MLDQLAFILKGLPYLLFGFPGERPGGLLLSVILAVLAIAVGFLIAVFIGTINESRFYPLRWLSRLYVEVFRGLPLLLVLVLVYEVIGGRRFGLNLTPRVAAAISLALYTGAYQAEIIRAGLGAVPAPIIESARLLGCSPWQVYIKVKLRYAFRVMLPALTGQAISLFKDTSVVLVIGVGELMTVARSILSSNVSNVAFWIPLYFVAGFLYWSIAFGFSKLAQAWERKHRLSDLTHSAINY
jgi:His/Glu/Gln/Arg/opine family amino acid ABC transporter permease subunit